MRVAREAHVHGQQLRIGDGQSAQVSAERRLQVGRDVTRCDRSSHGGTDFDVASVVECTEINWLLCTFLECSVRM